MNLTADQQNALNAIGRWLNTDDWMFYLGGYAGTGKTTLMHHFINSLGKEPTCLAPTGKAASVLQKRLDNAIVTTIHSALYKPILPDITKLEALEAKLKNHPNAGDIIQQIREEKERLARLKLRFMDNDNISIVPGELVIVDEASMVNKRMMEDLQKTNAKVLFVGDPGQLPPVGDAGYFTSTKPQAMLSQVMRQALDNPIVELSMKVRNREHIPDSIDNEHIQRRSKRGFDIAEFQSYDQIVTGKNNIRRKLNRIMRNLKGFYPAKEEAQPEDAFPKEGELLICLKNVHKFDNYLINGVQCMSTSDSDINPVTGDRVMDVMYEGDLLSGVPFYHYPFEVHYNYKAEEDPWPSRRHLVDFDYGYAITVHKSQGSEWDKVALVDDFLFSQDKEFRKRWLYTAITRAKQRILWIEMGS